MIMGIQPPKSGDQPTHFRNSQRIKSQQNRRAEDKTLCPEGRGLVDANGQLVMVPGPSFLAFLVTRFFITAKSAEKFNGAFVLGKSLEHTGISWDNP